MSSGYIKLPLGGGSSGPGTDGKTVLNGTTVPSNSLGTNGDFYIRTTTNEIYGPKTAGVWGAGVSLVGPPGSGGGGGGNNYFPSGW